MHDALVVDHDRMLRDMPERLQDHPAKLSPPVRAATATPPAAATSADHRAMPLSLSRTAGESIVLETRDGQRIAVTVTRIDVARNGARTVRLDVEAPRDVKIARGELDAGPRAATPPPSGRGPRAGSRASSSAQ